MSNLTNSLKKIEESLKQTITFYEANKKFFSEIRNISKSKDSDYDFNDFENLNVFEKCDNENLNDDFKDNSHEKLANAYENLDSILKTLNENRNILYKEYMGRLRNLSQEIHAISSVQAFIKHWDNKLLNDYQLIEYPQMFKKCFEKIPFEKQIEVGKMISKVKHLHGFEGSSERRLLNETNQSDILNRNFTDSNPQHDSSFKSTISSDVGDVCSVTNLSLPTFLKNEIRINRKLYVPGHTADIGVSVLDFTMSDQPASRNDSFGYSMRKKDEIVQDDLNESVVSFDNPLNNAIREIDDSMEFEEDVLEKKTVKPELPSFLNDSARCPPIEHADIRFESWSEIPFDTSIQMSMNRSIQESSVRVDDESAFISDQSIIRMQLESSGHQSISNFEISVDDVDYSFNRTRFGQDYD